MRLHNNGYYFIDNNYEKNYLEMNKMSRVAMELYKKILFNYNINPKKGKDLCGTGCGR